MAGSRGMVTSLMDTAHKTDTECHEAAITAIYTDKLYHRQDDTMAFRFQLSFSFMRTRDEPVISTGKETGGPLGNPSKKNVENSTLGLTPPPYEVACQHGEVCGRLDNRHRQ